MPQLRLVILLYQRQRMRISDLAVLLKVTSATVSGINERLVERGFVLREPDPDDRRAVICRLTDYGQQLISGFWNAQFAMFNSLLDELSLEHLRAYDSLLAAITDIIKRKGRVSTDAAV